MPKQRSSVRPKASVSQTDKLYFRAKRRVVEREVKEFTGRRDWESLEDVFYDYGRFLERHPEAVDTN